MSDPVTGYTKTQRIVLLVDLTPLLHNNNPSYKTTLLSAAKTILSSPPFSSSSSSSTLFSLKPFFSSLSPLLSSSKLPSPPPLSLSFDLHSPTLLSLSSLLSAFSPPSSPSPIHPKADHLAASLLQLLHHYDWDSVASDDLPFSASSGTPRNSVSSNLVLLFSPALRSFDSLAEFFAVGLDCECLTNVDAFNSHFRGLFGGVNDAFARRGIHLSWVDVRCGVGNGLGGECELGFGFFKNAIRDLGWGFCSSDSIVLGSAVVPFSLIYPRIGVSRRLIELDDHCKKIRGKMSLGIIDVVGKSMKCECGDLELVDLSQFLRNNTKLMDPNVAGCGPKKPFWEDFSDESTKLHVKVKAIQVLDEYGELEGSRVDPVLVREYFGDSDDVRDESGGEFFEDRVLGILRTEMGEPRRRKSVPIWQILLSFLGRKGYRALVSISVGNGKSFAGILKPFTVSSALLYVAGGSGVVEYDRPGIGKNGTNGVGELESNVSKPGVDRKKKDKKSLHMLQELTWSDFCKAALEHAQIELEEVYFARDSNKSKELKFLKCWMKQIVKSRQCRLTMPDKSKQHKEIREEVDNRLTGLPQENEQEVASSASGEDSLAVPASRIQDEDAVAHPSETLESFFSDLPKRIQQGLESEEVELGSFAERLVKSSIYWLHQKYEKVMLSESQSPVGNHEDTSAEVAAELTKLLLREPKDLASLYRDTNSSFQTSDPTASQATPENIVRLSRYELQILFRMEILQSEVGGSIGMSTKKKFLKHICSLLETIRRHLRGDDDWSLENYAEKIIKSRYWHNLADVVHKIYEEMDLLLCDEKESPNHYINSGDNNQSKREETFKDEMDDNFRASDPFSAEDESLQQVEGECQEYRGIHKEHARKLIEAQERRQRARRFSSFTSWVPDLQRVWAPKQPATRPNPVQLGYLTKRKKPRSNYDMVCNTPMSGSKRTCNQGSSPDDLGDQYFGGSCGSVSKALFQDD
ncbi:hypothetical protein Tsubulata_050119 [Turnera subulata]|uniref:Treslin N-terminal domain-containing protein n=1 Tax=Turnera subulata TaxID=218843 RepID=A0A9Q0JRW5_9ROSI|nr:hypothetical protein Tsubulata_050119 [Turnera subulata]